MLSHLIHGKIFPWKIFYVSQISVWTHMCWLPGGGLTAPVGGSGCISALLPSPWPELGALGLCKEKPEGEG